MDTPKAIGFDLGETLIAYRDTPLSWASLYRPALQRVAEACGAAPSEAEFAAAEAVLARHNTRITPRVREVPAQEIFAAVLGAWEITTATASEPETSERVGAAVGAFFRFFQQRMIAYPDSLPTLTALRGAGCRIGVLTDVPYGAPRAMVEEDLANAGLAGAVDVVLSSVEVGVRKPDPMGFIRLAAMLSVAPTELIYVGNEAKDIAGANAAGARSVLIDREGLRPQFGQCATIASLVQLATVWTRAGRC